MAASPRRRWSSERWHRIGKVAVVVGFCIVAGGVALATIPDAKGVIHGCYLKSGGTIRIIDDSVTSCKSTETALSWNVTGPAGPAGPAGPTGATGATGATGPRGPSDAFVNNQRGNFSSQSLEGNAFVDFVTLSLAPGSYVVNATAVAAGGTGSAIVQCVIMGDNGTTVQSLGSDVRSSIVPAPNTVVSLTLTTAFTLAQTTDVSLSCRSSGPAISQPSQITAIQVATVTVQ